MCLITSARRLHLVPHQSNRVLLMLTVLFMHASSACTCNTVGLWLWSWMVPFWNQV